MNIGELFIKLGISGGKKSAKEVDDVSSSLEGAKRNGLATKAAVIGVVYGLQRLTSGAARAGTGLVKFSRETDLSIKKLQEWEHAGRKANVESQEIESAFRNVQSAITSMETGTGEPPQAFLMLQNFTKDFDTSKMNDAFYMMEKLQEMSKNMKATEAVKFLGPLVGANMVGAMREDAFNEKSMGGMIGYTEKQARNLAKLNAQFSEMFHNFETGMGKVFAKLGPSLVGPLKDASKEMMKLVEATLRFIDKHDAIERIGNVLGNFAEILNWATGVGELVKDKGRIENQAVERYRQLQKISDKKGNDFLRSLPAMGINPVSVKLRWDKQRNNPAPSNTKIEQNITIKDSANPVATAKAVEKNLKSMVNKAYSSSNRGLNE